MGPAKCFVQILRGDGLRAADIGGRSDPYVICRVPGRTGCAAQTTFKTRTLSPVWNETLVISDSYMPGDSLEFVVMDHDYLNEDDFLGWAQIVGGDLIPGHPFVGDLALSDDGKHGSKGSLCKGSITVKVDLVWVDMPMLASTSAGEFSQASEHEGLVTRLVWARVYDKLDNDKDGTISRKEWCVGGGDTELFDAIKRAVGRKTTGNLLRKEWLALFDALDVDKRFSVSRTRIKEWLFEEGQSRRRLTSSADSDTASDEEHTEEAVASPKSAQPRSRRSIPTHVIA